MAWFGRRAAASPRPALLRALGSGVAGGSWPRTYEAQLRGGALANPIALRAIRLVTEAVAAAPVYAAGEDQQPARLLPPIMEAAATFLLLHGDAYLQIGCDGEDRPAELYALRPERVAVEVDGRGWPIAYRYAAGATVSQLPAQDAAGRAALVHVRSTNPLDDHYGLGCLPAAAAAIALHNAATGWNKSLLDNAARPSGALVYEPGEPGAALSSEQFDRLRAEMDASFSGAGNAGRPMLLEGGLRWQSLSMTPADMDFVGLKETAAREIALAFGVPPMLLGLPGDSTYANYREANRALWRLTVLPLAGKIVDAVAAALRGWWPELSLAIDLDGVPALAEDRERLWSTVAAADFLSADEKREMVGFGRRGA